MCANASMPRVQAKQDTADLQQRSKALKQDIATAEEDSERLEHERDMALGSIGNFVHDSVPVSADEASACIQLVALWTLGTSVGRMRLVRRQELSLNFLE